MGVAQTNASSAVSSPPRFKLFDALLAGARTRAEAEGRFASYPARMRFSVGQGVGLPRVPFAVGTDLTHAIRVAVQDLVTLVRKRADDVDFAGGFQPERMEILPRSFGMRRIPESAPERRVIAAIAGTDPLLDVGLLESWLLRGGGGGALFTVLAATYGKSLDEEARLGFTEPTAWATHLAISGHVLAQKDTLKNESIRGVPYEALERTVGIALSALLALALDEKLGALASAGILPGGHETAVLLRAACSPLGAVAIRQAMLRLTPNPYRLPKELAEALDGLGVDPLAPGVPCDAKVEALARAVARDKAAKMLCADAWGMNELRSTLLAYLRAWEGGPDPRHDAVLAAILTQPTLSVCLKDGERFDAGCRAFAALASEASGERRADAEVVLHALERATRRTFDVESMVERAARAWLLWRLDRWIEERTEHARAALVDRAREFPVAELKTQWAQGKVYRFAPDDQPILCRTLAREDAHFFLDLKGFTSMVARAKEVSTAEFLKHQFYVPILQKARQYREAGRRLILNNLLGDAVSFSGDVASLVLLAEDVNELFAAYEKLLRERGMAGAGRIEAGLFIAYGAAAETITIDDPVWAEAGITELSPDARSTRVKVAIAEKINESARGTARNGAVWARAQALLADRQQFAPAGTTLELPWRVYVDKSLQMRLPSRVMDLVEEAIDARSPDMNEMAVGVVRDAIAAVLAGIAENGNDGAVFAQTADLYNVGRALSREALEAFLRDTANLRVVARKQIGVLELHPDFRRLVFSERELRLVVSWDTGKVPRKPLVFRFAGELTFRGFEGVHTTEIYEIVDSTSPVYELLERHYLASWRPG